MITALVSGVFGLASGILPDLMKEIRETRESSREMQLMQMQHQHQMALLEKQANAKAVDADAAATVEDIKAFATATSEAIRAGAQKTDIWWVDAANAILRPLTTIILLFILVMVALGYSNAIAPEAFSALLIEAMLAVLGYIFGYRATRKKAVIW